MLINPDILFSRKANAEWFINLFSEGGGEENVGITIIPPAQRDRQGRGGIAVYYFSPVRVHGAIYGVHYQLLLTEK